jgi:hypothetical protein
VLPSISTPRTNTNGNTTNTTASINTTTPIQEHRIRLVPNVGTTTRCFVFDVIERTLRSGVVLKLGRYSDRNSCADRLSFKSKVVSRCHAELWQEDGKVNKGTLRRGKKGKGGAFGYVRICVCCYVAMFDWHI